MFLGNIDKKAKWYFILSLSIYLFSFLAGFSIGLLTVSIAFILFALDDVYIFYPLAKLFG